MELDEITNVSVGKTLRVLDLFKTHIRGQDSRKELPVQILMTFLTVAKNNGLTMREAATEMSVEQSTVSRNVKELDVYLEKDEDGNNVQKGCGLVCRAPNEYNRREYSVFLTAKGTSLVRHIGKILSSASHLSRTSGD